MFLGFLVAFAILAALVWLAAKQMPRGPRRVFLALLAAILAATSAAILLWPRLDPVEQQFKELCASPERHVVRRTVEVDYLTSESCWGAFKKTQTRPFQGFECSLRPTAYTGSVPDVKPYTRFVRGENWGSAACQEKCAKTSYDAQWEGACLSSACFAATPLAEPSFKYGFKLGSRQIVEGRLTESSLQFVDADGQELATQRDYAYHPYGSGWARLLGLAGGSPPTVSCGKMGDIFELEFLKPRASR